MRSQSLFLLVTQTKGTTLSENVQFTFYGLYLPCDAKIVQRNHRKYQHLILAMIVSVIDVARGTI